MEYARWAMARKNRRWGLNFRLFATDPWPIIRQAVERRDVARTIRDAARAFVLQGEAYFIGARDAALAQAKPVLLYYSFLNVAKALILIRGVESDLNRASHGLAERLHPGGAELVGAYLDAPAATAAKKPVFDLFWKALDGTGVGSRLQLELTHLLPQVVPGHRLWAAGANKRERFVEIEAIPLIEDKGRKLLWSRVQLSKGSLSRFGIAHSTALRDSGLDPDWKQVQAPSSEVWFEQVTATRYTHIASDRVMTVVERIAPRLWMAVLDNPPYRKNYLYLCPSSETQDRIPQLCSIYAIAFYLGSITRYRPHDLQAILDKPYGPFIVHRGILERSTCPVLVLDRVGVRSA